VKNRVVVRYLDGRVIKGYTWDFLPTKEIFHLADVADERRVTEISVDELKAVFFVRSFAGDPKHRDPYAPDSFREVPGLKIRVTFGDGEVVCGTTNAYAPGRKGFFLLPADTAGNNERVFVLTATARVETVQEARVGG
jgi:hypothetical protein